MRNPRLQVTLPPQLHAIIATIARTQRTSSSRVVADVLVEAAPVLSRIGAALATLERVQAERKDQIQAVLSDAQQQAESTAATALALLERIAAGADPAAGQDAQRPAGRLARRRTAPPPC